jgi:hypothetical protein
MTAGACGEPDARQPACPVWRVEAGPWQLGHPFRPDICRSTGRAPICSSSWSRRYERGSIIITSNLKKPRRGRCQVNSPLFSEPRGSSFE